MTNDLRKQAEAKLALSPEPLAATSPAETQRLLHELRVHQIELEMQNDELRKAQTEIEAGRVRYFDLYDARRDWSWKPTSPPPPCWV